jgi:hypothetical protein
LRDVPDAVPGPVDFAVARGARHAAYHTAADLSGDIEATLDTADPIALARIVADGSLLPLARETIFEVAVLIRLAEALESWLAAHRDEGWRCERGLIMPGRRDVFLFTKDDAAVRIFFNQSVFEPGPAELAASHYLGVSGRLRPDIVVALERGGRRVNAMVIECKHSDDADYLRSGYFQAALYCREQAPNLHGRIKGALVTSSRVAGMLRPTDEVVAMSWADWLPDALFEALFQTAA